VVMFGNVEGITNGNLMRIAHQAKLANVLVESVWIAIV
jgi:hypothetical protein